MQEVKRRLRFEDLKQRGIVGNRVSLKNWQKNHGFPTGQLTGPNTRTWTEEEIAAWLADRPTAPKTMRTRKAKDHVAAGEAA